VPSIACIGFLCRFCRSAHGRGSVSAVISLLIAAEAFAISPPERNHARRPRCGPSRRPSVGIGGSLGGLPRRIEQFVAVSVARYSAAWELAAVCGVLGAKRPQDRGCSGCGHAVAGAVGSAGQSMVAPVSSRLDLFRAVATSRGRPRSDGRDAYLPTRFCVPALCGALGQALVLSPWLFAPN